MENEKKNKITLKGRLLTGLLSLLIALGLWVYVVTAVSPESENTYYNIPVILQNEGELEKHGLMITTEQLPTVSLRLSGARADLQKLNSARDTALYGVLRGPPQGAQFFGRQNGACSGGIPGSLNTIRQFETELCMAHRGHQQG
jgi:hypothetical protein